MTSVKQLLQVLLDVILPPLCHICHCFIPNASTIHICPACRDRLIPVVSPLCPKCGIPFSSTGGDHSCSECLTNPPHFDAARAPFLYEGAIRDLIHSFKYDQRIHLRSPLALMAQQGMNDFLAEQTLQRVIPVPLHRSRLRQRGFNQAVLLGNALSQQLSLPMLPDTLIRTRPTRPQIELTATERFFNVKNAFTVARPEAVAGKRILLLDDVMTTGSTMNECARELKKAGAEFVVAMTIARTGR